MTHLDSGVEVGLSWLGLSRLGMGLGAAHHPTKEPGREQELALSGACTMPSLPSCHTAPSARFLGQELPGPALLCGLAGAQGQESPVASLPAAEQAGAGGAGRTASAQHAFGSWPAGALL
jgi:hypothetical protein